MFRLLFILFIFIPIIEIGVLMQVGALLGVWQTLIIVIVTAWLGAKYVKQQGLATLHSVQTKMAQGEMPSDEIVTGLMLLIAGVFLVTPGFVTDIFGLSLLIPAVRSFIAKQVKAHIMLSAVTMNHQHFNQQQQNDFSNVDPDNVKAKTFSQQSGKTLDGEFERKD